MKTVLHPRRRVRELTVLVVGEAELPVAGEVVCLVREVGPFGSSPRQFTITRHPRTNQSHEPRWNGWLGTTNDVDRFAEGAYEIRWIEVGEKGVPWYRVSLRPADEPALAVR